MHPSLLALGIALAFLLVLAFVRGKDIGWPRAAFSLSAILVGLFGVASLVIVLSLTYRIWDGVIGSVVPLGSGTGISAGTKAGSASSVAFVNPSTSSANLAQVPGSAVPVASTLSMTDNDSAKSDKSGTEAIANAMAAISAVVAVVTLVLTLGVTWFVAQLQELAKAGKRFDDLAQAVDQEHNLARMARETQAAFLDAKHSLFKYLDEMKLIRNSSDDYLQWSIALERLSSDSLDARFKAFDVLRVLAPTDYSQKTAPGLAPVEHYSRLCDTLAHARLKAISPAEKKATSIDPEEGLWCLIFDPIERLRYELFINKL